MANSPNLSLRARVAAILVLWSGVLGAANLMKAEASSDDAGRAGIGARLFRTFLSADGDVEKRVAADGALHLVIVFRNDKARATSLADQIAVKDSSRNPEPVKGLPVRVDLESLAGGATLEGKSVSAVFVAEALPRDTLAALVRLGIERHVIVFSPFEGDVEKGASGGISIGAQVMPFVNTETLRLSQITLSAFLMKNAKVYP